MTTHDRTELKKICNLIAIFSLGLSVTPYFAGAQIWYVAPDGNDAADGTNGWESALLTISNAVAKAAGGDTVLVSNGVYAITAPITIPNTKGVRVKGFNGPEVTIIDGGGNAIKGLYIDRRGDGVFEGLTIQNCGDGGVFINGSIGQQPGIVTNCIIRNNSSAAAGGGLTLWEGGSARNCVISNNYASTLGGGVYAFSYNGTVADCVIAGNTAGGNASNAGGGGIALYGNLGTVEGCVISGNSVTNPSTGAGGGVRIYANGAVVRNCVITGNSTKWRGAGVWAGTYAGSLENSVVSNNISTVGEAGGVWLENLGVLRNALICGNAVGGVFLLGGGVVQNCTICDNAAYGVKFYQLSGKNGACTNSIIYFNTVNYLNYGTGYTHSLAYSCITPSEAFSGPGLIEGDPTFISGTYRLPRKSICVDKGFNETLMASAADLDGNSRISPADGTVDMGAYEYQIQPPSGTTVLVF